MQAQSTQRDLERLEVDPAPAGWWWTTRMHLASRATRRAEFRNHAYSSKQCHRCGYVDAGNRLSQEQFNCRFCNTRCHADVNAARVVRDRRSIASSTTRARYRVNVTLIEQVSLFNERYPRPRGGPADPRSTNPYFKGWSPEVRSTESQSSPSPVCQLA